MLLMVKVFVDAPLGDVKVITKDFPASNVPEYALPEIPLTEPPPVKV